jgi:IS30 family transposase
MPKGKGVTSAEIRQWKAWKADGMKMDDIAACAGRHRSTIDYHLYPKIRELQLRAHKKAHHKRKAAQSQQDAQETS